jgi:glycosyltransferase involved in cell wall biosynthesis
MKLSVVIPCYNERPTIEAVVDAVRAAAVEDVETMVVDDGSTNGARELLKAKPPGWGDKIALQEGNLPREQLCVRVSGT